MLYVIIKRLKICPLFSPKYFNYFFRIFFIWPTCSSGIKARITQISKNINLREKQLTYKAIKRWRKVNLHALLNLESSKLTYNSGSWFTDKAKCSCSKLQGSQKMPAPYDFRS